MNGLRSTTPVRRMRSLPSGRSSGARRVLSANGNAPEPPGSRHASGDAPVRAAGGFAGKLMRINMAWCELLVLAMMLVVAIDVFMRAAFGFSLQVSEEIAGYLLVALVF